MLMLLGLFSALFAGAAADTMLSLRTNDDQNNTDEDPQDDTDVTSDDSANDLLSFVSVQSELPPLPADTPAIFDTLSERVHSSDAYPEPEPPEPLIATAGDSPMDLNGGALDDWLSAGAAETGLFGHGGNDILSAGTGPTHQIGGEGDDTLQGGAGDDRLEGGEGDDHIHAGSGNNTLMGGAGNDTLVGVALDDNGRDVGGQNFLNGGAGNDTLIAGAGDFLNGGEGEDSFILGQWLQGGDPVSLVDYDADEDQILLHYDPMRVPEPDVEIRFGEDALDTAQIWLNGHFVAQVSNAPDLTIADVGLIPIKGPSLSGLTPLT